MRLNPIHDHDFLQRLPEEPGVYRFYDLEQQLLYVGKALNLAKRVKSYFMRQVDLSPRISLMVKKIYEIEITLTANETSALLLETNLIKSHKPKYNIIFRDDKTYPLIRISQHEFPLIEYFRGKPSARGRVFGPYPNSAAVRETLDVLQRLFRLRTCSDITFANRTRPCMLYQVNLCSAPCVAKVAPADYRGFVDYAVKFLSGSYGDLIQNLSLKMYHYAEAFEFEQAAAVRDKISLLKELQNRQIISDNQVPINADILVYREEASQLFIYLILIRHGLYVADKNFALAKVLPVAELLEGFCEEYYSATADDDLASSSAGFVSSTVNPRANESGVVYCQSAFAAEFLSYFVQKHQKRILPAANQPRIPELMAMAQLNLDKIVENSRIDTIYQEASHKLAELLEINELTRIECYDTSHNHGTSAVASMVVYSHGKIDHKLYRRYNLDESVNGDDLRALSIVLRRRLANQDLPLPQVILVDGGRNQLAVTKNLLVELGFYGKIEAIAIFKGQDRKPELDSLIIKSNLQLSFREEPQLFKLMQALRDEAHRFAITGHRKKQVERMKLSRLEDIPGIGAAKRKALISFFGSAQGVAAATVVQLQQVTGIGSELAQVIHNHFHGAI